MKTWQLNLALATTVGLVVVALSNTNTGPVLAQGNGATNTQLRRPTLRRRGARSCSIQ